MKHVLLTLILGGILLMPGYAQEEEAGVDVETNRWSKEKANNWYDSQPWLVGCNFSPSTAINQLEMWQADTFDAETIDRELKWASDMGFNTVRVYLHDLAWEADAPGFKSRIDQFLEIAERHNIKTLLVLFDDCWNSNPKIGKQPTPKPGVHNSGWLQSPGVVVVNDPASWPRLERYVQDILSTFAKDERVLFWDLYNEPSGGDEQWSKSLSLLKATFEWARAVNPEQPLTAGVWGGTKDESREFQLAASDIITFHNYEDAKNLSDDISTLKKQGRPVICTEWLRRGHSDVASHLPIFKKEKVGCYNWGLVSGKTQTIYPWGSKEGASEPDVWFHDLLRKDGTPFDPQEITLFLGSTASAANVDIIHDETGFDGAVTVAERGTEGGYAYVVVTIPFRDMRNTVREGQARLYYAKSLDTSKPVPVLGFMHYPVSLDIAKPYCDLGYLVVTPDISKHPAEFILGDSINLNTAMLQWVRRLPIVDRASLQMTGGSAGGCMTLAMGAEFLPISALAPQLPAVNWVHGVNYLQANLEATGYTLPRSERPLPVLSLIAPGIKLATDLYGTDLSAPAYHTLGAISYLDRIMAPTLLVAATGDMLCRFEQFTAKPFFEQNDTLFPSDYESGFNTLTPTAQSRRRFDECIPEDRLSVHTLKPVEGMREYTREDMEILDTPLKSDGPSPEIALPWSVDKQWSLVILDEGPPLPHLGHTRYNWTVSPVDFLLHHRERKPAVDQLSAAKLLRLMERYNRDLSDVASLVDGTKVNRLSFDALDRLEVVTGLLDYAGISPDHAAHLEELYRVCPVRPFGEDLKLQHLESLEARLCANIGLDAPKRRLKPQA